MRVPHFTFCNILLAYNRTLVRVFGRSLSPKTVSPRLGLTADMQNYCIFTLTPTIELVKLLTYECPLDLDST